MGHTLKVPPARTSKGQHPGFSYEHPIQGYSKRPPVTVKEANCGFVQEDPKSGPPVNFATGAVLGNEIADPIFSAVSGEPARDPVCVEDEVGPELDDLEIELIVVPAAHPRKLGIVTLTPAHNWELKATASAANLVSNYEKFISQNHVLC